MLTFRRLQIDPYLWPCSKFKSKCFKDLNIDSVILNVIDEKEGSSLERMGIGDHFLNISPVAKTLREIIVEGATVGCTPTAWLPLPEIITRKLYSFKHCLAHYLQPLTG